MQGKEFDFLKVINQNDPLNRKMVITSKVFFLTNFQSQCEVGRKDKNA